MTVFNRFNLALRRENSGCPPIWLMRQAGRYHSHYQALKERHTFMELCKNPELACEVAMGPIRDFDFDAAILFSDLLFPLEVLGMDLEYAPGPKLGHRLATSDDCLRLREGGAELAGALEFQAEAMRLTRAALPSSKGLLGFVGGPMTLFYYAVEGSHTGELKDARAGLGDGRYALFCDRLLDLLAENMALQARAGADTVAVLDTCAGEASPEEYRTLVVPSLRRLLEKFHARCPQFPVTYYSKHTGPDHWAALEGMAIQCVGVDWHHSLSDVIRTLGSRWAVQGNIDPHWLFLPADELESKLRETWGEVAQLDSRLRAGWVCGLGHGVMQHTPEKNVRLFVRVAREVLGGR